MNNIVPVMLEYTSATQPNKPNTSPTANNTNVIALLAFPVMFTSLSFTPLFSVDSIYYVDVSETKL